MQSTVHLRQAFKMATTSLKHRDVALGAMERRHRNRMDKLSGNTAVAHKLARMDYPTLARGKDFVGDRTGFMSRGRARPTVNY